MMTTTDSPSSFGRQAWADVGGAPEALAGLRPPSPPVALPCTLDVAGVLGDCVGLATLAAAEIQLARGQRPTLGPVTVDGARVSTASQSERHFRLDGEAPEVWAPFSGFWEAADGWVRTHGNYPHHAERLARILGIPDASTKDQVADAVARRSAVELEDEAAATGAIVGAVRSTAEWSRHPHALATGSLPIVERHVDGGAARRAWGTGGRGPLSGVRVLDLTRLLAGPVATRNLAFLGADVLRIDSPHLPETGWIHLDTGAGKRSTTLDLGKAADRSVFDGLLGEADVVVTGYRPGALDALGLSPQALCGRRPGLVVGSVSAWGSRGPWAGRRGFDSIVQSVTGIAMSLSGDGVHPGALPAQALDHSAGYLLTAGICRALTEQRQAGGTRRVAVALATLARELLTTTGGVQAGETPSPTLQTGRTAAGHITCAAPPLTLTQLPGEYAALASPWGTDEPRWREQDDVTAPDAGGWT
jgi:crotonobetainyl-CoA:carnitine CoA-transferase CaiB-like acyl-CoA transferase